MSGNPKVPAAVLQPSMIHRRADPATVEALIKAENALTDAMRDRADVANATQNVAGILEKRVGLPHDVAAEQAFAWAGDAPHDWRARCSTQNGKPLPSAVAQLRPSVVLGHEGRFTEEQLARVQAAELSVMEAWQLPTLRNGAASAGMVDNKFISAKKFELVRVLEAANIPYKEAFEAAHTWLEAAVNAYREPKRPECVR